VDVAARCLGYAEVFDGGDARFLDRSLGRRDVRNVEERGRDDDGEEQQDRADYRQTDEPDLTRSEARGQLLYQAASTSGGVWRQR
jgi:hypothetical protein